MDPETDSSASTTLTKTEDNNEEATAAGDCVFKGEPFGFGEGTQENKYQVCTVAHLDQVRNYPNAYFKQVSDIDFVEDQTDDSEDLTDDDESSEPSDLTQDWDPIEVFNGSYDGDDNSINNMTINSPGPSAFITKLDSDGFIKNVKFNDISVVGTVDVAAVVIANFGAVENIEVTGDLTKEDESNNGRVGGVVSYNYNKVTGIKVDLTITNYGGYDSHTGGIVAFNEGEVTSSTADTVLFAKYNVGGCVGLSTGSLSELSCTSSVTDIANGSNFGGVVGRNNGAVSSVYANVFMYRPYSDSGGIAGYNDTAGEISQASSEGELFNARSYRHGGLVGKNSGIVRESKSSIKINSYTAPSYSSQMSIGGLVGSNTQDTAELVDSYFVGSIDFYASAQGIGGLVGVNEYNAKIKRNYSNGTITGGSASEPPFSNIGGIYGFNSYGGEIAYNFYNHNETENENDNNFQNGARTAEDLKNQTAFIWAGWDFGDEGEGIWEMTDGETMPSLTWESEEEVEEENASSGGEGEGE